MDEEHDLGTKWTQLMKKLMKKDDTKAFMSAFPADLCAGNYLIFNYTNIIEYQYVVDAKATLLRVSDSEQRLKNVSVIELEPTHRIVFFAFGLQKTSFKYNSVNFYRAIHQNWSISPLSRARWCHVDVTVQKIWWVKAMDSYYTNQASALPYFSGTIGIEVADLEL